MIIFNLLDILLLIYSEWFDTGTCCDMSGSVINIPHFRKGTYHIAQITRPDKFATLIYPSGMWSCFCCPVWHRPRLVAADRSCEKLVPFNKFNRLIALNMWQSQQGGKGTHVFMDPL